MIDPSEINLLHLRFSKERAAWHMTGRAGTFPNALYMSPRDFSRPDQPHFALLPNDCIRPYLRLTPPPLL